MKHIFIPALFCFIVFSIPNVSAQFLANPNFQFAHLVPCPSHTQDTVAGVDDWDFYQTVNNLPYGEKDSNICINVYSINPFGGVFVELNQIDTSRRLFVASKFDSTDQVLANPNSVYMVEAFAEADNFSAVIGSSCIDGPCSYVQIHLQHPDSSGNGIDDRFQVMGFTDSVNLDIQDCFPTERMDSQYIRQVVMAFKFKNVSANDTFRISSVNLYQSFDYIDTFSSITAAPSGYYYYYEFPEWETSLGMYSDPTYPDEDHISHINIYPGNNQQLTPQDIQLVIPYEGKLLLQPFTELRGAEVNGDSGVYHNFTLIDEGGDMCIHGVDVMFHQGDAFRYEGGQITFGGGSSCMVFFNGASMIIPAGVEFNYGNQSNLGLLSIRDSTIIDIGENATLNIFNSVILFEDHPEKGPKQFYIHLKSGSTLRFMPGSHLSNMYSVDGSIRLNALMEGGILDDSGLPLEERKLINRIAQSEVQGENTVTAYPNPFADKTTLQWQSKVSGDATIEIFNEIGLCVLHATVKSVIGYNFLETNLNNVADGNYEVRIIQPEGNQSLVGRIFKIDN